jgi:hypothetical protein
MVRLEKWWRLEYGIEAGKEEETGGSRKRQYSTSI